MSQAGELSTTSYAILGLLALRPWSTYELAKQMERSLRHYWPRAESKLYEEPKKLVQHGLARGNLERTGKRTRTLYAITPKGRRELARWLSEPGAGPIVDFEAMVKILFADQGSKAGMLANIRAVAAWTERLRAINATFASEYLRTGGPFPGRKPVIYVTAAYLIELEVALSRWASWAEAEVGEWPDTRRATPPESVPRRALRRGAAGHRARGTTALGL